MDYKTKKILSSQKITKFNSLLNLKSVSTRISNSLINIFTFFSPKKQKLSNYKQEQIPSSWNNEEWIYFNKQFNSLIDEYEQEKKLTSQKLSKIWENAQEYATRKIIEGGKILEAVYSRHPEDNSNMTASQRDTLIQEEIGEVGFLIWQEIIINSRTKGVVWDELTNLHKRDQEELDSIESNLLIAEKKLDRKKRLVKLDAKQKLEKRKAQIIWQPILNFAYKLLGIDPEKVSDVKTLLSQLKGSLRVYLGLSCLIILIFIGALSGWLERIEALGDIITAYLNVARTLYGDYLPISIPITGALIPKIWTFIKKYGNEVKQEQTKLEEDYQNYLQEAKKQEKITDLSQEVESLKLQAQQKRRQIGIVGDHSSLLDFVNNRLQEDSYGKRLGIIHKVSKDLEDLSKRLDPNVKTGDNEHIKELFPRGGARIILYIDDLDRCPPDRVVDVLEAVQLLINTPLFIVILAIDDRYIARALEQAYQGVLKRRGHPSGIDYLEKIIQIPYRTRPINRNNIEKYLKAHLDIEGETSSILGKDINLVSKESQKAQGKRQKIITKTPTSTDNEAETPSEISINNEKETSSKFVTNNQKNKLPPQIAKFTQEEFNTLKDYCQEVDLSPRTAKRLINIYKILKILWFRSERDQDENADTIKKAVLAMLVLSGRYPTFMREVFTEIARFYEEKKHKHHNTNNENQQDNPFYFLYYFFEPLKYLKKINDIHLEREKKKFENDVETLISPLKLTLSELKEENFHLALSFCFVGDIGYDPEDYQDSINQDTQE